MFTDSNTGRAKRSPARNKPVKQLNVAQSALVGDGGLARDWNSVLGLGLGWVWDWCHLLGKVARQKRRAVDYYK